MSDQRGKRTRTAKSPSNNIVGNKPTVSKKPKGVTPPGDTSECCDDPGQAAGLRYWDGDERQFLEFPTSGNFKLVCIDGVPRWENNT
jgi:hypothetical protein